MEKHVLEGLSALEPHISFIIIPLDHVDIAVLRHAGHQFYFFLESNRFSHDFDCTERLA